MNIATNRRQMRHIMMVGRRQTNVYTHMCIIYTLTRHRVENFLYVFGMMRTIYLQYVYTDAKHVIGINTILSDTQRNVEKIII